VALARCTAHCAQAAEADATAQHQRARLFVARLFERTNWSACPTRVPISSDAAAGACRSVENTARITGANSGFVFIWVIKGTRVRHLADRMVKVIRSCKRRWGRRSYRGIENPLHRSLPVAIDAVTT
jgi:hypothetical protein